MMGCQTLYISFDLETLGGNPDCLPVINWGFVAYLERVKIGELSVNTKPLRGDQDTIDWFQSTPELQRAYEYCTREPVVGPKEGMEQIRYWMNLMKHISPPNTRVLLVAYPTVFDGSMLYYYWFRYLGHPTNGKGPGFTVLDIRSFAAGHLGISYFEASKEKALKPFVPTLLETQAIKHTGLWDAQEQLMLLFNVMDHTHQKLA
jgi:hypothetical protein